MSLAPRGYTVALTRLPLHSVIGVYRLTARKGERQGITGTPVLNVKDGVLNSVTVYRPGKRALNIPAVRVAGLFTTDASNDDLLAFAALTR